jgi:toxin ParE1/3/4
MAHTILWSKNAEDELLEIVSYIKEHSDEMIAKKIYGRIKSRVLPLRDFPETGRVVPELAALGILDVRQVLENPWKVYYRVGENTIKIL